MPTYRVKTNRGTFEIKANREPSPAEAEAYLTQQQAPEPSPSPTPAPAPAPAPVQATPPPDMVGNSAFIDFAGLGQRAATGVRNMAQQFTQPLAAANQQFANNPELQKKLASTRNTSDSIVNTAIRMAPLGAAAAFPPAGIASFAGLGAGMAGADQLARMREGMSTTDLDAFASGAKAFTQGVLPSAAVNPTVATGLNRYLGAAAPLAHSLGQAAKVGTMAAATEATSEIVRRSIEQQKLAGYDSLEQMFKQNAVPMAFGGALGFAGASLGRVSKAKVDDDAAKALLAKVDIDNPTLAMVRPSWAADETRFATKDRLLWEDIAAAEDSLVNHAKRIIGTAAQNGQITEQLRPLAQKVDMLAAAKDAAEKEAQAAMQALTVSEQKLGAAITPDQLSAIRAQQQAINLNLVNKKAAMDFELAANLGPLVSHTDMAKLVGSHLSNLTEARSAINGVNYNAFFQRASEATGMPFNAGTPILPKQDAVRAAEEALRNMGSKETTATGEEVIAALAGMKAQKVPRLDASGMPVLDKAGNPIVDEVFNKAQIDGAKNYLASKFASSTPGGMSLNEAEQAAAYGALNSAFSNRLKKMFPDGAVGAALTHADEFNRTTAQIMNSSLGRAFMQKANGGANAEVQNLADQVIETVANGMVNSKVDEIKQFKDFIGAVGNYNIPVKIGNMEVSTAAIAQEANATMAKALANAYRLKHTTDAGTNYDAMFSDILTAAKKGGDKMPVPVETLGFGNIDQIRDWKATLRKFDPKDITDAVVADVLASPVAQKAIANGALDTEQVLSQLAAGRIFNDKVEQQVKLQAAGLTADARRAADAARNIALQHKISAADAQKAYEAAKNDPITGALAGQGKYKWADETASKPGEPGTVTHFLTSQPVEVRSKIMKALKENNPQLHEVVERRVLSDAFENLIGSSPVAKGGSAVDFQKVREFQNPFDLNRSKLLELRQTVGPEAAGKFESLVKELHAVDETISQGRGINAATGQRIATILGVGSLPASGMTARPGAARQIVDLVMDLYKKQRYNTLSAMLLDRSFANNVNRYGLVGSTLGGIAGMASKSRGGMADVLSSFPAQKAALLMSDRALMSELGQTDAEKANAP